MNKKIESAVSKWKNEYEFKTVINSSLSFLVTFIFAVYNAFLGIRYKIIWNLSISIYYIFLVIIRGIIIKQEHLFLVRGIDNRQRIHTIISVMLIVMNLALIMPITLMIIDKKNVSASMIPAISIAAYTTFKITMASINLKKSKKSDDLLIKDLRNINFIDALMSVLTLQNTLISVKGENNRPEMVTLSAVSSGIELAAIIILTVMNIRCNSKNKNKI